MKVAEAHFASLGAGSNHAPKPSTSSTGGKGLASSAIRFTRAIAFGARARTFIEPETRQVTQRRVGGRANCTLALTLFADGHVDLAIIPSVTPQGDRLINLQTYELQTQACVRGRERVYAIIDTLLCL